MGTFCFMVHSMWVSRTSGGSMGRFALARAVPSHGVSVYIMIRVQVPAPPALHTTTTPLHPLTHPQRRDQAHGHQNVGVGISEGLHRSTPVIRHRQNVDRLGESR